MEDLPGFHRRAEELEEEARAALAFTTGMCCLFGGDLRVAVAFSKIFTRGQQERRSRPKPPGADDA